MPRANRHFIPGYVWHITHRCHKKEFLKINKIAKDDQWSESVAVGSKNFIINTMEKLGIKAKSREAVETVERYQLKEPAIFYKPIFAPENNDLRPKNTYFWDDIS
jgi:putative transposase